MRLSDNPSCTNQHAKQAVALSSKVVPYQMSSCFQVLLGVSQAASLRKRRKLQSMPSVTCASITRSTSLSVHRLLASSISRCQRQVILKGSELRPMSSTKASQTSRCKAHVKCRRLQRLVMISTISWMMTTMTWTSLLKALSW